MGKNYYEEIESTVDHETGEVTSIKKTVKRKVERDKFALLYLKDLANLLEISTKGEYKVLLAIVERSHYNTNEFRIGKDVKQEIAKKTKLSYATVDKAISKLSKSSIIMRKKYEGKEVRGAYILNPQYFFKGEELERAKLIEIVLQYEVK